MERRHLTALLLVLRLGTATTAVAADGAESAGPAPQSAPASIEALVVTGTRSARSHQETPASVSIVGPDALSLARPAVSLGESLARVPGLLVQESGNFAQDARIQIRGFGTRAAFGIREIKVLVDGLPATLADGQTQIDDLDLAMTDRIEVVRGASASLYGNAAGGVVQIFTREPPENPGVTARILGGSFGLLRASAQGDARWDRGGGYLGASWLQQDGYRDHARTRNAHLSGKAQWNVSDTTEITLLLQALDAPQAQDPGGLTLEEVEENRRSARERNVLLGAGEEVQQVRLGLVGSYESGPHTVDGNLSLLYRNFFARLPILPQFGDGVVSFDRLSPAGGIQYQWNGPLLGWTQRITTGLEVQYQNDDRRRWANEEGEKGDLGLHQREEVTSVGVFLREDFELLPELELTGGVRYDAFFYAVDVRYPIDSGDSGDRTMDHWSPSAGLLWTPRKDLSIFGSFSTAFQVPTTTELVNPNGAGFNADIKPQTAQSWEIGSRFERESLTLGLSFFLIDLQDELIPYETVSGRIAFRNAGRSQRRGVEIEGSGKLPLGFSWTVAAAALDARYIKYATDNGQFDGNDEPGIPPWQAFGELSWRGDSGLYLAAEVQAVGAISVDDANLAESPSYVTLGLRMAWMGNIGKHWQVQPFLGVRNLNSATYDGTLRINARGGRFYEPAARLNWYAGFEANWSS